MGLGSALAAAAAGAGPSQPAKEKEPGLFDLIGLLERGDAPMREMAKRVRALTEQHTLAVDEAQKELKARKAAMDLDKFKVAMQLRSHPDFKPPQPNLLEMLLSGVALAAGGRAGAQGVAGYFGSKANNYNTQYGAEQNRWANVIQSLQKQQADSAGQYGDQLSFLRNLGVEGRQLADMEANIAQNRASNVLDSARNAQTQANNQRNYDLEVRKLDELVKEREAARESRLRLAKGHAAMAAQAPGFTTMEAARSAGEQALVGYGAAPEEIEAYRNSDVWKNWQPSSKTLKTETETDAIKAKVKLEVANLAETTRFHTGQLAKLAAETKAIPQRVAIAARNAATAARSGGGGGGSGGGIKGFTKYMEVVSKEAAALDKLAEQADADAAKAYMKATEWEAAKADPKAVKAMRDLGDKYAGNAKAAREGAARARDQFKTDFGSQFKGLIRPITPGIDAKTKPAPKVGDIITGPDGKRWKRNPDRTLSPIK